MEKDVNKVCNLCKNKIGYNEHVLFNCENVREIRNMRGIIMNFDIKCRHI